MNERCVHMLFVLLCVQRWLCRLVLSHWRDTPTGVYCHSSWHTWCVQCIPRVVDISLCLFFFFTVPEVVPGHLVSPRLCPRFVRSALEEEGLLVLVARVYLHTCIHCRPLFHAHPSRWGNGLCRLHPFEHIEWSPLWYHVKKVGTFVTSQDVMMCTRCVYSCGYSW